MRLRRAISGILLAASMSAVIGISFIVPKADVSGDWVYSMSKLTGYIGSDTEVTIPYKPGLFNIRTVIIGTGSDESKANLKNVKKVTFESGYTKINTKAIYGFENVEEVVIPEGVTEIEHMAFYGLKNLKKVQLPSSLKILGNNAFNGCISLESINLPEGLETIERSAFANCTGLKSVTLPNSLKEMGYGVFSGCLGLKDAKGRVIVNNRLYHMDIPSGVTEVTIPAGIKVLEAELFSENKQIKKVIIPEGVTKIEHRVFYKCSNIEEIVVPSTVEYIGTYAFLGCSSLKKITIPQGVEHGINLFRGCAGLQNDKGYVIVNGILCDYLGTEKDISLPDGVKEIEQAAIFKKDITSVKMPDSLVRIADDAFDNCTGLKKVEMSDSVTEIGSTVFEDCTSLTEVKLSKNLKILSSSTFRNTPSLKEISIPEGVEEIGYGVFESSGVETVFFPSTLKKITYTGLGEGAKIIFKGSYEQWKKIEGIKHIPDTVRIDFANPTPAPTKAPTNTPVPVTPTVTPKAKVTSAPKSSTKVTAAPETSVTATPAPDATVNATPAPEDVAVQPTVAPASDSFTFKGNTYKIKGKNVTLIKGAKKAKVSIPATVKFKGKKYKVTAIGASAFKSNKKIKSVTIGKNVKVIGKQAFYKDTKLGSVTIKSKLLKSSKVGKSAFKGLSKSVIFKVPASKKKTYSKIVAKSLKKYKIK